MIFFISTDKIKKLTGTAETLNDEVLRVGLYQAQIGTIYPLIGLPLSEYLGLLITAGLLIDDYKELVESYLQPILAWQTLSNAVEPNNSNTTQGMSYQVDLVAQDTKMNRDHYRWIAQGYIQLALNYLCRVRFPYYKDRRNNTDGLFQGIEMGTPIGESDYNQFLVDESYKRNKRT